MPAPKDFKELVAEAVTAKETGKQSAEELRVAYLGRKGKLAQLMSGLAALPPAKRQAAGKAANQAKAKLTELLLATTSTLTADAPVDVTMPGKRIPIGHRHPVTLVIDEIIGIFSSMGFYLADGPEVEDDWHNFESLNIPADHPGRDMQDTFYVAGAEDGHGGFKLLPRTQTTAVTARELESGKPPLRMFTVGKVFRNETEDATHGAVFNQLDALMIDSDVSFADLKGILSSVVRSLLGDDVKVRFRPSYFPFTEPSAEVDVSMPAVRDGQWLELAGAGMVHPNVLRNTGIDPRQHQGFAFAFGIERIAMLKYELQDLRPFYKPDLRILEQF